MKNCKNRIMCILLCGMMLSTLMPISVLASELKVSDGIAASVRGEGEGLLPDEEAKPESEPSEDLPPLTEGEGLLPEEEAKPEFEPSEDLPPLDGAEEGESPNEEPELEPSEDLPPLIEGEEGVSPDEAGAGTVEDMTLLMEAVAPVVTGGALLADWTYTEEANRIILDQYMGTSPNVIIPGVFDGKNGKSVEINASRSNFLPENTKILKIGDGDNTVTLSQNAYGWLPENLVEADFAGLRYEFSHVNMFKGMTRLERINVTGWDVSKVRSFDSAFEGCTSLRSVDLSSWVVSAATSFSDMFSGCTSLVSIDLSSWADKTAKVRRINSMFERCTSLEQANLSGWKLPNVHITEKFVKGCTNLRRLDLSGWTVGSSFRNAYQMFYGAHSLEELDLSDWDVSKLETMQNMFRDCYSLKRLDLTGWKLAPPKGTTMDMMFSGCKSLTKLDLNDWDMSNVTRIRGMFHEMNSLETLKIGEWTTSSVTDMSSLFYGTGKLRDFEVEKWDTSAVTTMDNMFYGNGADEAMNLSKWDTSNVTSMAKMFYGRDTSTTSGSGLSRLNLTGWKTSKVEDMTDMFAFCENLQLFDLSSFVVDSATGIAGMFRLNPAEAVPTFIVSDDDTIRNQYANRRIEGRVHGGPSWNANGGLLNGGVSTAVWGDKFVYPDKSDLTTTDLAIFDKYTASKDGDTFQGWFLDEKRTQEFRVDRGDPQTFDFMSDPKYVNMVLHAGWGVPKSRVSGYVKMEGDRKITASLKRQGAVIATAVAIQGKFTVDVDAGVYTLELSAPAAFTRSMEITVETSTDLEVVSKADPLTLVYGDANEDGIIDALDLGLIKTWFGKIKGDADYTEYIDINVDGIVDALDLGHVKTWFGSTSGSYV